MKFSDRERFLDWTVYQIYPRSFCDTNGDGVGDLNGVIEKLDHLTELGVSAIWLCPCYQSPNRDNGYDVSDYREIMDEFGTLDDWKHLREATRARGIRLIMDLVANHTSAEHAWFQEARSARDNPYHEYYIWSKKPPNRWKSLVGGSAWEYNPQTNEYYLHSFAVEQPDLNWENPKVRAEMRAVVEFWTNLGVDGFRCDMLDFISKDFKKGKMLNGPHLQEYIDGLFKGIDVFTVGECQSDEKNILSVSKSLTTVFQFEHIQLGRKNKYTPRAFSYDEVKKVLVKWQEFSQKHGLLYTLFTDNHDQPFYLSRMGNDQNLRYECATMYGATFYLLRGIPFLYQGQEFGFANPYYPTIEYFEDIETLNYYRANESKKPLEKLMNEINYGSRDNTRRPMAWTANEKDGYGFSTGKPWLAYHSRAKELNAETDKTSEKSVFEFYRKLLAYRNKSKIIRRGSFRDLTRAKDCFVYERAFAQKRVLVVCNFERQKKIPLPEGVNEKTFAFVLGNYKDFEPFSQRFRPFEIAVYEEK